MSVGHYVGRSVTISVGPSICQYVTMSVISKRFRAIRLTVRDICRSTALFFFLFLDKIKVNNIISRVAGQTPK